jgi:hypothetical protein
MRREVIIVSMEENKTTYNILVAKPQGKKPPG